MHQRSKTNQNHNFQLVYPHEGVVCKSNTLTQGAKKCYQEFKRLNTISDGMFTIKDLDRNKEYSFKVENHKMFKVNDQRGGQREFTLKNEGPQEFTLKNEELPKGTEAEARTAAEVGAIKKIEKEEKVSQEMPQETVDEGDIITQKANPPCKPLYIPKEDPLSNELLHENQDKVMSPTRILFFQKNQDQSQDTEMSPSRILLFTMSPKPKQQNACIIL